MRPFAVTIKNRFGNIQFFQSLQILYFTCKNLDMNLLKKSFKVNSKCHNFVINLVHITTKHPHTQKLKCKTQNKVHRHQPNQLLDSEGNHRVNQIISDTKGGKQLQKFPGIPNNLPATFTK